MIVCAVLFIGVVVSPLCMVTEFCSRGNLFDLLHNAEVSLPWPLRKRMALDAAKGMTCTLCCTRACAPTWGCDVEGIDLIHPTFMQTA